MSSFPRLSTAGWLVRRKRFTTAKLVNPVTSKWASICLVGFIILMSGILAALWKLGILANIGTTWTVIGVVIAIGLGIMIAVSHSGTKENIQIDQK